MRGLVADLFQEARIHQCSRSMACHTVQPFEQVLVVVESSSVVSHACGHNAEELAPIGNRHDHDECRTGDVEHLLQRPGGAVAAKESGMRRFDHCA